MSKKIIKLEKDKKTGDAFLNIEQLKDMFDDVSQIKYYEVEELKKGAISLKFFDKNKKIIKPKGSDVSK